MCMWKGGREGREEDYNVVLCEYVYVMRYHHIRICKRQDLGL
jgi:hypothetical protein